jgi:hypothetical protein
MNYNSSNIYSLKDITKILNIMIMPLLGLATISHIIKSLDWDSIFSAIGYTI